MSDFHGQPSRSISTETITLEYLERAGPRIVRLSFRDDPNLFAEVPGFTIPTPLGDYHLWGGHRLWHAPEEMPASYIIDDDGLTIHELPDGVILEGKIEPQTGLRKKIEIRLAPDKPLVRLVHTLTNHGRRVVERSPWSITQLRLGGTVIAPLPVGNSDPHGLLPNRHFSLWPYTRMRDPRLEWQDACILVKADAALPACKIGYFNPHGWLAYWIDGVLFRKKFEVLASLPHPDGNCNAEIYCNDRFVELESLAPLSRISPGEKVELTEEWELFESLSQPFLGDLAERVPR